MRVQPGKRTLLTRLTLHSTPFETMASESPRPASPREADPEQSRAADASADHNRSRDLDSTPEGERTATADSSKVPSSSSSESGEASESASPAPADEKKPASSSDAPPLPSEHPPLPSGPPPATEDDGWDFQWDPNSQAYFFYNRFTGMTQWDNPRVPTAGASASTSTAAAPPAPAPGTSTTSAPLPLAPPPLPSNDRPAAGGYNPAIHGDYDPNAWYAQGDKTDQDDEAQQAAVLAEQGYNATAQFNRFTGQFQTMGEGPDRHSDEAKSRRQMNAFFDVDAAANAHDGRSLKAERSGKKPSKSELKHFKEKRRARKEEKRRAWLRD
ncbi:WW domain-containing protein [Colletotrichum truncatum]|uniref:WW domain-containing protein n=1 Tax=Colletotrichum truncatum TaxID=5467 RepID=A0ACC3YJN2_COLTU|nr:WW domain-containing protein [Colletotrichum truncatum]KAF6797275.1 WW domain-containing protein [Colletotrichum truncatum]